MADDRTLLAHVVLKLATHPENIAVEALGHILSSSAPTRLALGRMLQAGGADIGPIERVETQVTGEEGERPDLVGFDAGGAKRLLIEAKFWAGLTESQPVAYLRQLPEDEPSALLFVAPAARTETLWPELRRRVWEAEDIALDPDSKKAGLVSATVGDNRRLMLTSWKALLGSMVVEATHAGDSRADVDIQQLLGLTQQMDQDAFLPLRPDEFGPEFPRRMRGLRRLIDDATNRGTDGGWASVSGMKVTPQAWGYGRYVKLGSEDAWAGVWFGVNFNRWARQRSTPLWLAFYDWSGTLDLVEVHNRVEPLQREDPPGVIDVSGRSYAPLYLPTGIEYDAVLDAVVARLKHIADLIGQGADA